MLAASGYSKCSVQPQDSRKYLRSFCVTYICAWVIVLNLCFMHRGEKPWDSPGKKLRIFQFLLRHTFDPKVGIKSIAVRIVQNTSVKLCNLVIQILYKW